jgi:hypothetical protein
VLAELYLSAAFVVDHLAGCLVMADIYTSEINGLSGKHRSAREDRLSPGVAVFAILAMSLLLWTPLLLPLVRLLHG